MNKPPYEYLRRSDDWVRKEVREAKSRMVVIPWALVATVLALACVVLVSCDHRPAHADPVIPSNLWQGLIAEATSEGYQGMEVVACVTRNRLDRGMSHGLVALKRKDLDRFCRREGFETCDMAKDIVYYIFDRRETDVTGGADHYEHTGMYPVPKWAKRMKVTNVFFKGTKHEITCYDSRMKQ
jgi:hypothetical protein